jgi:hypothetical protein
MAAKDYSELSKDELIRLLEARSRRDAARFGVGWEANDLERDRAPNQDSSQEEHCRYANVAPTFQLLALETAPLAISTVGGG